MPIQLNKPYKIVPSMLEVYERHYNVPAALSLVIPTRMLGEEVACDVRWQNNDAQQVTCHAVFISENLMPIEPFEDDELYRLWKTSTNPFYKEH
jgi:hypothetical protein